MNSTTATIGLYLISFTELHSLDVKNIGKTFVVNPFWRYWYPSPNNDVGDEDMLFAIINILSILASRRNIRKGILATVGKIELLSSMNVPRSLSCYDIVQMQFEPVCWRRYLYK